MGCQGKKPLYHFFIENTAPKTSVISAVDLIKGIGMVSGMKAVNAEGATGNIHKLQVKLRPLLKELKDGRDFVYIHVEAPDECGHQGQLMENTCYRANRLKNSRSIDKRP